MRRAVYVTPSHASTPQSDPERRFAGQALACRRGGRPVFERVGFALAAGECLVLTGPNGAGKSSLLRLMAGLLAPSHGDIRWNGALLADQPEAHARRLCYVGHMDALKPAWSLARNLAFWSGLSGTPSGPDRVLPALERLGVGALADIPVGRLSRGQARRGALARLLLAPRALWLLDEPTASLDDASSAVVSALVEAHCAGGGIAVVATHRPLGLEGARTLRLGEAGA